MRRSLAIVLLFTAASAGCGGSSHQRVDPERMLDDAARHPISSAQVEVDARLQVLGVERLSTPLRLRFDGPYSSGGGRRIPSFDWRVGVGALGFTVGGRAVSTGENVYLSIYGDDYEVGTAAVAAANRRLGESSARGQALDVEPRAWFGRARVVGDDSAGGTDCERISAPLRGEQVAHDLTPLVQGLGLSAAPSVSGTTTACIGYDDRVFHELELDAELGVAVADRARLGGATGARLNADVVIGDVGEGEPISAPGGDFRPIRDLFLTLNDLGVPIPL
jgi:hypothetical protein